MWRLGIDTGGTFTDIVAMCDGQLRTSKVSSTPAAFELGVLNAISAVGVEVDSDIRLLAHGTTVTTNAVITKTGATTGLITTRGFRDVLELRRADRGELYDLLWDPPEALVPRRLRREVTERVDYAGAIVTPLVDEDVEAAVEIFKASEVEAVAVCFLNSYQNTAHEERVRDLLVQLWPNVHVTISSDLIREPREFERTATAVANAYVAPVLRQYVGRLQRRLRDEGFSGRLMIMHSGGGLFPAESCLVAPARTVTSGPAAGVMAAEGLATQTGTPNMLSLDMGGTSADIAVVLDGKARLVDEHTPEWGLPIRFPAVDLLTIGAGGGSIAWVETTGTPKVGPQSAGAVPGPACYARGGTEATVTDANLLLGRLSEETELADNLRIDFSLAHAAVGRFADQLGLSVEEAALGIIEIANSNMAKAVRVMTVERGLDPRDFTLLAFGGAGPMHACELAEQLGMDQVMVPVAPGVTSALGTMFVDVVHDLSRSHIQLLDNVLPVEIERTFQELEAKARHLLDDDLVSEESQLIERSFDLRYVGQGKTLNCSLQLESVSKEVLAGAREQFLDEYQRRYQYVTTALPIELAVVRVRGRGVETAGQVPRGSDMPTPTAVSSRTVAFRHRGAIEAEIYRRADLGVGTRLTGPLVVEQMDSTTVIPPEWNIEVDALGNLVARRTHDTTSLEGRS